MVKLSFVFFSTLFLILSITALASAQKPKVASPEQVSPAADHHQHLFSQATLDLLSLGGTKPLTAEGVISLLDEAGIDRATILSVAYMYGRPGREPQDEYAKVKADNDWTGDQSALYPKRLIAFCSFNPLKDYALASSPAVQKTQIFGEG